MKNNNKISFNFDSISNTTLSAIPAATSADAGFKAIDIAVKNFIRHLHFKGQNFIVLYLNRVGVQRVKLGFTELGERKIIASSYSDFNVCAAQIQENLAYNDKCMRVYERGLTLNFIVLKATVQDDGSTTLSVVDVDEFKK